MGIVKLREKKTVFLPWTPKQNMLCEIARQIGDRWFALRMWWRHITHV
jgi:hypothetical protein